MQKKRYESQKRAVKKYLSEKMTMISFRCHDVHDADVIEWFAEQPQKARAMKELIRAQIEREQRAKK